MAWLRYVVLLAAQLPSVGGTHARALEPDVR